MRTSSAARARLAAILVDNGDRADDDPRAVGADLDRMERRRVSAPQDTGARAR
jgi:hypothetical protein